MVLPESGFPSTTNACAEGPYTLARLPACPAGRTNEAIIDSRDFLAARRRAETEVMLPAGAKIAFTGGRERSDITAIWAALDRVHAKHPGMVLLNGGSPTGAERIAACRADSRKVAQVAFKPNWHR